LLAEDLDTLFALPLSPEVYEEMLQLQDALQIMEFDPVEEDSWIFIWGNQKYSSWRYYQMVFENYHSSPVFKPL
jgi:hypothetical protein